MLRTSGTRNTKDGTVSPGGCHNCDNCSRQSTCGALVDISERYYGLPPAEWLDCVCSGLPGDCCTFLLASPDSRCMVGTAPVLFCFDSSEFQLAGCYTSNSFL